MVAAMMMLMMIMRLCSGPFSVGLGWVEWADGPLPHPGRVFNPGAMCTSDHLDGFTMDLARWRRRPDPDPNLVRTGRLDGPHSVSPRA